MKREIYDEDHEAFRSSVKEFLDRSVVPHVEEDNDPMEASGHAALYATAGGELALRQRQVLGTLKTTF